MSRIPKLIIYNNEVEIIIKVGVYEKNKYVN